MNGKMAVIITAAIVVVLCGSSWSAQANGDSCRRECQQQFLDDKRECREDAASSRAGAAEALDACLAIARTAGERRACRISALRSVRPAMRDLVACNAEAKRRRDACRAACRVSPSEP